MIALDTITLIALCYNTVKFLLFQKRYKVMYISLFYALSIIIMMLRVAYFILILVYLNEWEGDEKRCPYRNLNNVDNYCVYFDLILGIQTMSMMVDLSLNVKTTAAKEYSDR